MSKKLLLHICCGPCSNKPIDELILDGYDITGFFYNPNIHPEKEFYKREDNLKKLNMEKKINIKYVEEINERQWREFEGSSKDRCEMCYKVRLEKTAKLSKENNFDYFSTTLMISPYQDHEKIIEIGKEFEEKYNVKFLYKDFRKVFRESYNLAREKGIYTQKYCGCIISLNKSPFKDKITWE